MRQISFFRLTVYRIFSASTWKRHSSNEWQTDWQQIGLDVDIAAVVD